MKDIKVQFAKDGIKVEKVIVGEDHYQVTLITPAEQELKPVEGKWYRRLEDGGARYTIGKFYQSAVGKEEFPSHCFFIDNNGFKNGESKSEIGLLFDLSTPLDFDPETLVGKTLEWIGVAKVVVTKIEWPNLVGSYTMVDDYSHSLLSIIESIQYGSIKVIDPEPTLTVPESVEFVSWAGDITLVYNGLILGGTNENGFGLRDYDGRFSRLETLKLIPCKLEEVKNGEWVVRKEHVSTPLGYWLVTNKGAVSFENDYTPIKIEPFNDGSWQQTGWLKVVQG